MEKRLVNISRRMSGLLRHHPEKLGLNMDENGWVLTKSLLSKMDITNIELEEIVNTNDKQRFEFSFHKDKIRARQGHSIDVDVNLVKSTPPDILYHGTATSNIESILGKGIFAMNRLYVHLSTNKDTAIKVGSRHGNPVIFTIDTKQMDEDGFEFYLSNNGVWLTKYVEEKYVKLSR